MKKYNKETIVGIFMLVGLSCLIYMAVNLGDVHLLYDDAYKLYARFQKVNGLQTGNAVQMLGLEIGKTVDFQMDQESQVVMVGMQIDQGIQIFDDAIATIKTEGLIGDKYVDIDPGGAGKLLKPGDTIIETLPPVEIYDLLSKYAFGEL
jgi:phospholipid/cholesterol/gamma-HCH transport system substrate-binding protein